MPLLDSRGNPIQTSFKKATPPRMGEQYGTWAGDSVGLLRFPGAGAITFDLDRLTLGDFRNMKDHYQINSSLTLLSFMLHQIQWHIDCEQKKIADEVSEQLNQQWSRLVRALSQAFWAGYSPNVLQWDNDVSGKRVVLDKIKDLYPEDCKVRWKKVEGDRRPNGSKPVFSVYDGIIQAGAPEPIPVDNSFWYPLLMDNANYYGRKLLRSAFQPWFFSILMHLFANRYYERYGEPVPIGRAPYDENVRVGENKYAKGNELMEILISQLRNRTAVVLPNDRTAATSEEREPKYDYSLEYLESQMRGADFERYMTRLDEEMSLALFTPILMMRTAEVGSYNLGVGHTQTWLHMINAVVLDWAHYINRYILSPITNWNFGINAPRPKIRFMPLGRVSTEMLRTIVAEMMKAGSKPDLQQVSEQVGMTFSEYQIVAGNEDDAADAEDRTGEADDTPDEEGPQAGDSPRSTAKSVARRLDPQIRKAYKQQRVAAFKPEFGYQRKMELALREARHSDPEGATREYYRKLNRFTHNLVDCYSDIPTPDMFMRLFYKFADDEARELAA